jgi:hypothetical protein
MAELGIAMIPIKIIARRLCAIAPVATTRKCTVDFLNGTTIVPFVLMLGSVASRDIHDVLTQTNMAFIGIAGAIGLVFVVGELLER